jgi:Relaxase/Mobilisation nuclease domain
MISKNYPPAKSFLRQARYLCQDQTRSQVLYQEGVRGHDYRLMAGDFEMIHQLRPGRSHPVFHSILDFHPDERWDDAKMVEIAVKYLPEIRMINTQYAIIKHTDTTHTHMHIIANRIDYNGNHINTYPEILNSKDAVRKLIREYDLMPLGSKNLRQTNFDALDNSGTRKYAIYRSIKECLPGCRSLEELEQKLLLLDIETRYRINEETGQRLGISFRYQNEAFKGRTIDRDCSLLALQRTLALKQDLTQWESEKLVLRATQVQQEQLSQQKEAMEQQQREKQEQELRQRQTVRQVPRLRIHH